jgi:hypothetical protein
MYCEHVAFHGGAVQISALPEYALSQPRNTETLISVQFTTLHETNILEPNCQLTDPHIKTAGTYLTSVLIKIALRFKLKQKETKKQLALSSRKDIHHV